MTRIVNPITDQPITKGWIPQGRDTTLEQQIIGDLLSRCGQPPLRHPCSSFSCGKTVEGVPCPRLSWAC